MDNIDWLHPSPFVTRWRVQKEQIDHYHHVNNVEYMRKLERVSWEHTYSLGLTIEDYQSLDRGMAIRRHEIDYLAAAKLEDTLLCATWVTKCDKRLCINRQFQIVREQDRLTILKASTEYVCIALSTGRPKRMPNAFAEAYGNVCVNTCDD